MAEQTLLMMPEDEDRYNRERAGATEDQLKLARLLHFTALRNSTDGRQFKAEPAPVYLSLAVRLTEAGNLKTLRRLLGRF